MGSFYHRASSKEFENLNLNLSDYESFVKAIPFNTYPLLALTIVPALALMKLDFGPMKKVEDDIFNDQNLKF